MPSLGLAGTLGPRGPHDGHGHRTAVVGRAEVRHAASRLLSPAAPRPPGAGTILVSAAQDRDRRDDDGDEDRRDTLHRVLSR